MGTRWGAKRRAEQRVVAQRTPRSRLVGRRAAAALHASSGFAVLREVVSVHGHPGGHGSKSRKIARDIRTRPSHPHELSKHDTSNSHH